ncbi:TPA: heme exporter protein CcmB [Klebsiella pneumoniae]
MMRALLARELRLAWRSGAEILNPLWFFLIVITLFPFGVGAAPQLLAQIAPGVVWVAALLAALLVMDRLFRDDWQDGSLEQLLLLPTPLVAVVLVKVVAHWMMSGLPLLIVSPLAALLLMTFGALWQKRSRQAPADVLPLQYAVSLGLCLLIAPVSGFRFTVNAGLIIPVLFLGLLISVVAQLLLYRLLSAGNIVNVTSLFYLVPAITALLDYLLLGNRLPAAAMIGMMAIVGGIVLVFRTAKVRAG